MRIKKSDLATEKEIMAFFTKLMREDDFEITLRVRAAEMLCKHFGETYNEPQELAQTPLYIQVDYGKEGE